MSNQLNETNTAMEFPRKPYRKPSLSSLGDLRSLTLGGSIGVGESGGGSRKVKVGIQFAPGDYPLGPDGMPLMPPDGSPNP